MKPMIEIDDKGFIFGSLFSSANTLQVLMDRSLAEFGITSKQWFLSAVVMNFFDHPPTLKEVADMIGNSHQNVKQIALKLEEKGLLELWGDEKDGRVIRLHLTDKAHPFRDSLDQQREIFFSSLFQGLSNEELGAFRKSLAIILENMDTMKKT